MNKEPKKTVHKSNSCYDLTPEQIYDIVSGNENVGIQGYRIHKKYFDYKQCLWLKKREEILKKHKSQWPPENWPLDKESGTKKPPKRIDFIDEQISWANSFTDPKKTQELRQNLEAKGHRISEPQPFKSDFDKKINKKDFLKERLEREKELEKIRQQINSIPEYKQNAVDSIIDKVKSDDYKPREKKSSWSKNVKIMYNADSEFLGEQIPFWNPNSKEEDKKKAEFFPNKIKFMRRSPSWKIGPSKFSTNQSQSASEYIKARDERLEEKANSVFQKMGVDKKSYIQDAVKSYQMIHDHGKLPLLIRKVYDFANTDQYKAAQEKRFNETPAPNTYWDDGKAKIKLRKNIEDDQAKKYVMPRENTYKRLYTSGMRKSVY